MIHVLLFSLLGCEYGFTLPSSGSKAGDLVLEKFKLKERRSILPGSISGPPVPEPGIYASQCEDLKDGGPVNGPSCITNTIHCGETVVGHTIGGVNRYNTRFYEATFCTPATTNHDGGDERVYRLDMPEGNYTAIITLDTPCADLDVAALRWDKDQCPKPNHLINQCEMWPKDRGSREQVRLVSQHETSWYVVVEGKDEEEGAFSLTVQCFPGLG